MGTRTALAESVNVLATAKVTIGTATTTSYDFGTPDDIDLASLAGYRPGDRIFVAMSGTSGGNTDDLTFVVQDADDNAGSIGTPATADVNIADGGTLAGGTGDHFIMLDVELKPGRPWLRFRVTSDGTTDTFVTHCQVMSVPRAGM